MSYQIITSDLFAESELSARQQELIVGGMDYQLKDNSFTQAFSNQRNNNNSTAEGNTAESNTDFGNINSQATSFLASEPTELPTLPELQS
jgi:hypothetical protein